MKLAYKLSYPKKKINKDAGKLEWQKLNSNSNSKNQKPVATQIRYKIEGKRLKIDNYEPSLDSGIYICVASGTQSKVTTNSSIYLGDLGRLTIKISRLPVSAEVNNASPNGRVIELSCQVTPSNSGKIPILISDLN